VNGHYIILPGLWLVGDRVRVGSHQLTCACVQGLSLFINARTFDPLPPHVQPVILLTLYDFSQSVLRCAPIAAKTKNPVLILMGILGMAWCVQGLSLFINARTFEPLPPHVQLAILSTLYDFLHRSEVKVVATVLQHAGPVFQKDVPGTAALVKPFLQVTGMTRCCIQKGYPRTCSHPVTLPGGLATKNFLALDAMITTRFAFYRTWFCIHNHTYTYPHVNSGCEH
jgi:hypothetical protein